MRDAVAFRDPWAMWCAPVSQDRVDALCFHFSLSAHVALDVTENP